MKEKLESLFRSSFGELPNSFTPLPQGGSDRKYFRLTTDTQSAIGAYNPNIDENRTFIYLTNHFAELDLPVPKILGVSDDESFYLLTDLGDQTLFYLLLIECNNDKEWGKVVSLTRQTLEMLAKFQVLGAKGLDFSRCYPKAEFDQQSVMWDFYYFKYSFLKPSGIRFNETKLDDDFLAFAKLLLSQPCNYFHYRDFQSRNVMLVNNQPFFIDYQGGRRGPLLYDVASFLYQARANFSNQLREELLDYYLDVVGKFTSINQIESKLAFPLFALFRVIQTLGAYGFRGFFERRAHFLQSIPLAVRNLAYLLEITDKSELKIPELRKVLIAITQKFAEPTKQTKPFDGLTVEIISFSYKKGYPLEHPEHGGGFVFDCRALPNPGRLNQYKMQTGLEKPVIEFLENHAEIDQFFEETYGLLSKSVENYKMRGFKNLSVSYGCTGGQHRSVYMANRLAKALKDDENIRVILKHREINS